MNKQPFAVKSESFELYVAFKMSAEKIGWKYNSKEEIEKEVIEHLPYLGFGHIEQRPNNYCLCIYDEDCTTYILPQQWDEAIAAAKAWFEEGKPKEKQYRKFENVNDLFRGDIIKNNATGNSYVVEEIYEGKVIGVRTVHITNPAEWEVLK